MLHACSIAISHRRDTVRSNQFQTVQNRVVGTVPKTYHDRHFKHFVLLHYPVPSCDTTSGTSVVRCLMVERTHPWEAMQGTWWQGRVCFRQIMLFLPAHHKVINSVTIRKTSLLWSFCCFNLNLQYDQYINFPFQVTWFWSSPITLISIWYLGILLCLRYLEQLPINQPCLVNKIRCSFYLF